MEREKMTKFRVAPSLKSGTYVAAHDPVLVAKSFFPDREVVLHREGKGWWQFKVDPPIPFGWPNNPDEEMEKTYGNILDVENTGHIYVVTGDENGNDED